MASSCPLVARRLQKYVVSEVDIQEPGHEGECLFMVPGPLDMEMGGAALAFDNKGRVLETDIVVGPEITKEGVKSWLAEKARECRLYDFHRHGDQGNDIHLESWTKRDRGCTVDDVGRFLKEYGY